MIRKVSVAPMMDCTDRHDRYFLRLISKNVMLYTDMIVSEAIKRGDKIITSGGIFGIVEKVMDNDKVEVSISDNVNIELVKSTGIQALVSNTEQKK